MLESLVRWMGDRGALFVFDRGAHLQAGVASSAVMEDLEVFEDGVGQLDAGAPPFPLLRW